MNSMTFWSIVFGLILIMLWLPFFSLVRFFLNYGKIDEVKYGDILYHYKNKKPSSFAKKLISAIFVFVIIFIEFPVFIKSLDEGIYSGLFILSINVFIVFFVLSLILSSEDLREYFITNNGFLVNYIPKYLAGDWRGRRKNIIFSKNYTSKFIPFSKISSFKIDAKQEEIKINVILDDLSYTFKYDKEDLGRIQSILTEKRLTFI